MRKLIFKYSLRFMLLIFGFIFFYSSVVAQSHRRSYTASKFSLQLDGSDKGFLQPVRQGDTLIYTINKLSDSVLIRQRFDSTFGAGKQYYLKYRKKNTVIVSATKRPG